MPTIIIGQQPSLKPEQIAPHLTLLWQKFIEQKENDDGLKHYDAFVEHVVGTCTTILELDLFLGLRKTIADFPHLLAEYAENNELLANQVVAGTNKMLKWVCKKCGYPWETTGASRAVGATGCRACANLAVKPDKSNSLAFVRPDLAAEYTDDNELPADEVITGTKTKLKWVCRSCGHRWEATGADRVRGRGCPVCANRVIKPDKSNSLAHTHPHLVAEYADDNELPADQVVAGTNKKLKWVCKKCGYSWNTAGSHRAGGNSCPACANDVIKPDKSNSLAHTHPHLVAEYADDNELPADQVVAGTNKKLKWVCKKCGYRWESMGSNRVAGKSCRACANHIVKPDKSNSLARMYPELLEDYADDNEQLPDEVVAHTSAKLKWKCHTCGYRWVVPGNKRARGDGCRACDNKAVKPDKSNSLAYLYPDLFAEYAPENDLPADEVVAETEKKLKWVCKKCAYPWEAVGSSRIRGHGCPLCGIKKARETRRRNRVK